MPHKRAKKSARDTAKKQQGNDLAPTKQHSLSDEPIPKSASRILNAAKIRQDYNERKRKGEDGNQPEGKRRKLEDGTKKDSQALSIKPGESIQHFYRRVEDDMRPMVKAAVQTGNAAVRHAAKKQQVPAKGVRKGGKGSAAEEKEEEDGPSRKRHAPKTDEEKPSTSQKEVKDFAKHSSSAPRRLNDVVQAPPELKKLPRGAAKLTSATKTKKSDGILSMAQKQMMEVERERAIARYRELKESKRKEMPERSVAAS